MMPCKQLRTSQQGLLQVSAPIMFSFASAASLNRGAKLGMLARRGCKHMCSSSVALRAALACTGLPAGAHALHCGPASSGFLLSPEAHPAG